MMDEKDYRNVENKEMHTREQHWKIMYQKCKKREYVKCKRSDRKVLKKKKKKE